MTEDNKKETVAEQAFEPVRAAMHPGRKSKLTPEITQELCNLIVVSPGIPDYKLAMLVGVSAETFRRWQQKGKERPESKYGRFLEAIKKAHIKGDSWARSLPTVALAKVIEDPTAKDRAKIDASLAFHKVQTDTRKGYALDKAVRVEANLKVRAENKLQSLTDAELLALLEAKTEQQRKRVALVEGRARLVDDSERHHSDSSEARAHDASGFGEFDGGSEGTSLPTSSRED